MSYTTIGAILTGVGALCQMVASGFSQQIEVLQTKKTDSLEDVKTRLESTKNKPIYVKFDGRIDCAEPIHATLSRDKACWCLSENLTNNGLIDTTVTAAKDVVFIPTSESQGIKLKTNRYFEHHLTPLMLSALPFSAPYYQFEKYLAPATKVFMIGHVKRSKAGHLRLLWHHPSRNPFKVWTQPTIIDTDPEQRVTQLKHEAELWHKIGLLLVTAGVGTMIYDHTTQ